MRASEYLNSLGVEQESAASPAIGRLSIAAEFELDKQRGVIVRPKRGGISTRYLEMMVAQGIDFVVVDGAPPLAIYGRSPDGTQIERLLALPVPYPSRFPSPEMFHVFINLVKKAVRRPTDALHVGSQILVSKLEDEASSGGFFAPAMTRGTDGSSLCKFIDKTGLKLPTSRTTAESMATLLALLAGYIISPRSDDEAALLVEFVARLAEPKSWGLPHQLAFAVTGSWTSSVQTVVASAAVGVQLLPLRAAGHGQAVLSSSVAENALLHHLFPNTRFVDSDFLSWSSGKKDGSPERLFVVPPFGRWVSAADVSEGSELSLRQTGKAASRVPAEVLYVEHAMKLTRPGAVIVAVLPEGMLSNVGHADFRSWLLERSQLLAVVSLPARSGFAWTGVRCSILYLKKVDPVPPDYPILMLDVEEDDVDDPKARARIGAAIAKAVAGGGSA